MRDAGDQGHRHLLAQQSYGLHPQRGIARRRGARGRAGGHLRVCDDVYNRLVYVDGYERFAQRHPELREQTVIIESFSKPWSMTGWRLGCSRQRHPSSPRSPSSPILSIECRLLRNGRRSPSPDRRPNPHAQSLPSPPRTRTRSLRRHGPRRSRARRSLLHFPSIKKFGLTSEDFCIKAIKEANVALVPGNCFGTEGHVRLSYCVSDQDLDEGLHRLSTFISTL